MEHELLQLIEQYTNLHGSTWREKRDRLINQATDNERVALDEFASWFEPKDN